MLGRKATLPCANKLNLQLVLLIPIAPFAIATCNGRISPIIKCIAEALANG